MAIFENKGHYLLITADQPYSPEPYLQAMKEAVKLCEQQNLTRILTDIRTVDKDIPLLDRFKLGTELARLLGAKYKLAILARAESIDKMGENAAVNRGARVFVTASLDEALSWFDSNS